MLLRPFKDLEWHKEKKHRHRRLTLLRRDLPFDNQSRGLQHILASLLNAAFSSALLASVGLEVASAPLQFLPDHAEKRHIRQ